MDSIKHLTRPSLIPKTESDKKIEHINSIANFPLVLIMGASGNGKDTIINSLLQTYPDLHRIPRATTRPKKERDQVGDFEYMRKEDMLDKINNGDVLFPYHGHRDSEQEIHGLLYKELLQLQDKVCLVPRGMGGLEEIEKLTIPVITITIIGDKEFVIENLKTRDPHEADYQENIKQVSTNINNYLNKAFKTQIIVRNEKGALDKTTKKIKELIDSYIGAQMGDKSNKILGSIRLGLVNMMRGDTNDIKMEKIIYNLITDEIGKVQEDNIKNLISVMYTAKNSRLPSIIQKLGVPSHHKINNTTPESEIDQRKKIYRVVAQTLWNIGKTIEAEEVLLQIGLEKDALSEAKKISLDPKHSSHDMINHWLEQMNNPKNKYDNNAYINDNTLGSTQAK